MNLWFFISKMKEIEYPKEILLFCRLLALVEEWQYQLSNIFTLFHKTCVRILAIDVPWLFILFFLVFICVVYILVFVRLIKNERNVFHLPWGYYSHGSRIYKPIQLWLLAQSLCSRFLFLGLLQASCGESLTSVFDVPILSSSNPEHNNGISCLMRPATLFF